MKIAEKLLSRRSELSDEKFRNLLNRESVYSVCSTNLCNNRKLIVRVYNDSSVIGQDMYGFLVAADCRRDLELMDTEAPVRAFGP